MQVIHLTQSTQRGGAAIAAFRIHQAVTEVGVESIMFSEGTSNEILVKNPLLFFDKFWRRGVKFLSKKLSKLLIGNQSVYFSTGLIPSPWHKHIEKEKSDIIHLHFLGNEILSIKQIAKFSSPIVITVHDYWVLGSGYHLSYLDDPSLNPQNRLLNFLMKQIKKKKVEHWSSKNITFVAPSTFVEKLLKNDPFFSHFKIKKIHHPLKIGDFKKINRQTALEALSIRSEPKYLLFPAGYGEADPNKGFLLLKKILCLLKTETQIDLELLMFGEPPSFEIEEIPYKIHFLGRANSIIDLCHIYSAANVMLLPSRFETYGLVVQEAIECGLAVVATAGLGMDDLINQGKNGFLVNYDDLRGFSKAIQVALNITPEPQDAFLKKYDSEKVGLEYSNLYKEAMGL